MNYGKKKGNFTLLGVFFPTYPHPTKVLVDLMLIVYCKVTAQKVISLINKYPTKVMPLRRRTVAREKWCRHKLS